MMSEVHSLRRGIQSELKMAMTDYEAYMWKNAKTNFCTVPTSIPKLNIPSISMSKVNIGEAVNNLNFPILSAKVKDLCMVASAFLNKNSFSVENFDSQTIELLVENICERYNIVSYHNFSHAFSVFLLLFQCFERSEKLVANFSAFEVFVVYFSALCHDLNHPGTNSLYEIKRKSDLALLYNNESVLENMHISQVYRMLRDNEKVDIISGLKSPVQRERMKKLLNKLIVSTDFQLHSKNLKELSLIRRNKYETEFSVQEKDVTTTVCRSFWRIFFTPVTLATPVLSSIST